MKRFFIGIIIVSLIISPTQVGAQITPVNPTNNTTLNQLQQQALAGQRAACLNAGYYWENNKCSKTSTKTQQNLQRFRPGVDIQTTGKKIGGISFSGIGSSVLGCLDVGGKVVNGISDLFSKKAPKATSKIASKFNFATGKGQAVPTTDSATQKSLEAIKKKETCLDAIAYTLSRQALAQVTNKTLNWINTGLQGNPLYVTNMNSFLGSIRDEKIRDYIGIADNINKKNGDAVGPAVTSSIIEMITGRRSKVQSGPTTPAQQAYDDFTNDFTKGGWDSWYEMTQLGNNPIAGVLNTSEQLGKQIAQEQENAKQLALQGNGFLPVQECKAYAQISPDDDEATRQSKTNADGSAKCLKYEIKTPGSIITSQAQTITNSPTQQLQAADELNEVLGAFFDNMLNKLIQKGLNGLHRETARSLGGNYSASLISGGNVGGIDMGYQASGSGADVQDFDISRPQQLRAVMQTQYDFLNTARDSQIAMQRILPSLGALDYCIPGPNPSWAEGLNENFQNFISSFITPTKSSSGVARLLSTIPILGSLFSSEDKEIQYALTGEPTLFDKSTNDFKAISPWSYLYFTKDYCRGVKNTVGNWIWGYVSAVYDRITTRYQKDFTANNIISLFTTVDPNTSYATGAIKESLNETNNLLSYQQTIGSLDAQYDEIISNKEDQLVELEAIRREANDIVKRAKARYIASQAAAGTPVNLSCINRAYIIDESPIVPLPRQESDATNPMIQQMLDANDYFYTTL